MKKILNKLRSFKIGIKNIFVWMPIIYRDRNWDYSFLLIMLEHKLKLMEKTFENGDELFSVGAEVVHSEIKMTREALTRILEQDYVDIGELDLKVDEKGRLQISGSKSEEERAELYELERKLIKEDYNTVFNTMRDKIANWWD